MEGLLGVAGLKGVVRVIGYVYSDTPTMIYRPAAAAAASLLQY